MGKQSEKNDHNLVGYAKETSRFFVDLYGDKWGRSLNMTGAAATASTFMAFGKLLMGLLSLSLFTCINALFSFGMIGAKGVALTGICKSQEIEGQAYYYKWSGIVIIFSSILYILYSVRLFFSPIRHSYHMYIALGIATVTFTEIIMNIRGVIVTKRNHTLLIHAVKMINLSGACVSLVLTQTALLSFTDKKGNLVEISNANATIGIIMASIAAIIGLYMIIRGVRIKAGHYDLEDIEAKPSEQATQPKVIKVKKRRKVKVTPQKIKK